MRGASRVAGDVVINVLPFGVCLSGLVLSVLGLVRGDQTLFLIAFSLAVLITGSRTLTSVLACCQQLSHTAHRCKKLCRVLDVFFFLGNLACLCLLIDALNSGSHSPENPKYGCVNGYGCANIVAIVGQFSSNLIAKYFIIFTNSLRFLERCFGFCHCFSLPLVLRFHYHLPWPVSIRVAIDRCGGAYERKQTSASTAARPENQQTASFLDNLRTVGIA